MSTLILEHIYESTPIFTLDYSISYFAKTILHTYVIIMSISSSLSAYLLSYHALFYRFILRLFYIENQTNSLKCMTG